MTMQRQKCGLVWAGAIVLQVALLGTGRLSADDWPQWMGPERDGIWREDGILERLPEQDLRVVWRVPIQGGYSGPAVSQGRLYVMDFQAAPEDASAEQTSPGGLSGPAGTERIRCLDAKTGEAIWTHAYPTKLDVSYPGGPRSTPTIDGDNLYALGTMGQLMCLQADSGEVRWQVDLTERFQTKPPIWGYASHPLVFGDLLICTAGGQGSGVVALDKNTGAQVWTAITAQEIGYAPPVLAEMAGRQQLVVWYDVAMVGLDPKEGKQLWQYDFPKEKPQRPVVSIVPPLVAGNRIFITNFYHGSALVEVAEDGVRELWTTEKNKGHREDINSIMSTVIHQPGYFIGVAGNGELRCVAAEDASLQWRSYQALATAEEDPQSIPRGTNGFAAMFITQHQDRYWMFSDQGELILAELSAEGYQELGRQKLLETTGSTRGRAYVWCPPAFAQGYMFVRNEQELICVDLRKQSYEP